MSHHVHLHLLRQAYAIHSPLEQILSLTLLPSVPHPHSLILQNTSNKQEHTSTISIKSSYLHLLWQANTVRSPLEQLLSLTLLPSVPQPHSFKLCLTSLILHAHRRVCLLRISALLCMHAYTLYCVHVGFLGAALLQCEALHLPLQPARMLVAGEGGARLCARKAYDNITL